MSDEESREREVRRRTEAIEMDRAHGLTDDTCHGRCEPLRAWFAWECRGLLHEEESHEVLDMLLNRLVADGLLP
jgi:hypothetical protein